MFLKCGSTIASRAFRQALDSRFGNPLTSFVFQRVSIFGCTLFLEAISFNVLSPRSTSITSFAFSSANLTYFPFFFVLNTGFIIVPISAWLSSCASSSEIGAFAENQYTKMSENAKGLF
jgi:hypothetical protein